MNLRFLHDWPLEETLIFEDEYLSEVKIDLAYKYHLKEIGTEFIYLKDSDTKKLIGETYFIEPEKLDEPLAGVSNWLGKNAVYVYSTTILSEFQNEGLGKVLKAYFLGYIKSKYRYVIGHAREGASIRLNEKYGAQIIKEEDNWQDSGEKYYFYKIDL